MAARGKKIIFDTDMGPDDAWALILLLKAAKYYDLEILAITCLHGNSSLDYAAKNTMRVLEAVNRLDIPVYLGAASPILYERNVDDQYFGVDGFGDNKYDKEPDMSLIKKENAINALYRLISENSQEVTLICVGPLTNIALALRMYRDFGDHISDIYIMGGNHQGVGNITSNAEYNFYVDPEAAHIVLNSIKKPMYILPWESLIRPQFDLTTKWRYEELGTIDNQLTRLMNPAEEIFLKNGDFYYIPDQLLVAAFLNPKQIITKSKKCYASVELGGTLTRAQMVVDHLGRMKIEHNVTIIELVNVEQAKQMLLWAAGLDSIAAESALGL